jgi:hypothetical protein
VVDRLAGFGLSASLAAVDEQAAAANTHPAVAAHTATNLDLVRLASFRSPTMRQHDTRWSRAKIVRRTRRATAERNP